MSDKQKHDSTGSGTEEEGPLIDEGRRRLIRQSALATPVVLTVVSRPSLAGTQCTLSGMASGNLSGPQVTCVGCTPGYWKQEQHFSNWMTPYVPEDNPPTSYATTWKSVFGGNLPGYGDDLTLLDALGLTGGGYKALARHTVAALLNGAYYRKNGEFNFGYTDGDIISLYKKYHHTDAETLKNSFEILNKRSCPLT